MPNDINELDETDAGLKAIFGDRFQTVEGFGNATKKQKISSTTTPTKTAQKPMDKPVEAQWEPVRPTPNQMDKLKACAKSVLLFGGLSFLIFYWQQLGLMASSIAVPCMCACTALAGWGVGKNVTRG